MNDQRLVILIPGHARDTPGKRSPMGFCAPKGKVAFREYKFNWDQAKRTEQLLHEKEIPCTILGVSEFKDVSVMERARMVNRLVEHKRKAFVMEIHANAHSNPKAHGMEAWTSKGSTKSDRLAEIWYREATRNLPFRARTDYSDGDADKEGLLYMPDNTSCPHLLMEYGFYTNVIDLRHLQCYDVQEDIAQVTANTAIKFGNELWR